MPEIRDRIKELHSGEVRICSTEDCGQRHQARGYCKRCYKRQVRQGNILTEGQQVDAALAKAAAAVEFTKCTLCATDLMRRFPMQVGKPVICGGCAGRLRTVVRRLQIQEDQRIANEELQASAAKAFDGVDEVLPIIQGAIPNHWSDDLKEELLQEVWLGLATQVFSLADLEVNPTKVIKDALAGCASAPSFGTGSLDARLFRASAVGIFACEGCGIPSCDAVDSYCPDCLLRLEREMAGKLERERQERALQNVVKAKPLPGAPPVGVANRLEDRTARKKSTKRNVGYEGDYDVFRADNPGRVVEIGQRKGRATLTPALQDAL